MSAQQPVWGRTFLVTGPETLCADRAVDDLRTRALAEAPEAQTSEAQAGDLDVGSLTAMTGASLLAEQSVAIIRDLPSLPAEVEDTLLAIADATPTEAVVVLVHPGGQKGSGLVKKLKKARVEVIECPKPKPWEAPGFVTAEARRLRATLEPGAAEAIVAAVGSEPRTLAAALAQLQADSNAPAISEEAVKRYFAGRAEITGFTVVDEVMARRRETALEKLRWALETGVAPVLITSAMAAGLRGLGKFRFHDGPGMRDGDLAKAIGVHPFKIKDYRAQARLWTDGEIARGIGITAQADADVKGAAGSPEFALERMVLALLDT